MGPERSREGANCPLAAGMPGIQEIRAFADYFCGEDADIFVQDVLKVLRLSDFAYDDKFRLAYVVLDRSQIRTETDQDGVWLSPTGATKPISGRDRVNAKKVQLSPIQREILTYRREFITATVSRNELKKKGGSDILIARAVLVRMLAKLNKMFAKAVAAVRPDLDPAGEEGPSDFFTDLPVDVRAFAQTMQRVRNLREIINWLIRLDASRIPHAPIPQDTYSVEDVKKMIQRS